MRARVYKHMPVHMYVTNSGGIHLPTSVCGGQMTIDVVPQKPSTFLWAFSQVEPKSDSEIQLSLQCEDCRHPPHCGLGMHLGDWTHILVLAMTKPSSIPWAFLFLNMRKLSLLGTEVISHSDRLKQETPPSLKNLFLNSPSKMASFCMLSHGKKM